MSRNSETLLMEYAAGTLDTAHNIIIASYLTFSPEARRTVAECEKLGGAMIEHMCDCAEMSNTCLESVLTRIDNIAQDPCGKDSDCVQSCIEACATLPQPLSRLLPKGCAAPKWRRAFGGMEWIDLKFEDSDNRIRLIRCTPGFTLPHHIHRGLEVTLVLDGAFEDETGRYVRGDLIVMEEETNHAPAADAQAGCMILTLSPAPIRFTGLLTRFLNPFI